MIMLKLTPTLHQESSSIELRQNILSVHPKRGFRAFLNNKWKDHLTNQTILPCLKFWMYSLREWVVNVTALQLQQYRHGRFQRFQRKIMNQLIDNRVCYRLEYCSESLQMFIQHIFLCHVLRTVAPIYPQRHNNSRSSMVLSSY